MEQISQRSLRGAKYVDKLAQVSLKEGSEQWLLVHVEVQGEVAENFSLRMFRYFYRIFDRYGKRIASVALLTEPGSEDLDPRYELKAYGSGVVYEYLAFHVMEYERKRLEADNNPIALVVLVAQEKERAQRTGEVLDAKRRLIRKLYEQGYPREEAIGLFEFIDWAIQLDNEEEDEIFWEDVKALEEEKKMPYVTTGERIGLAKGLQQGMQQGMKQGLREGLLSGIELGLELKFGSEGLRLLPEIARIEDVPVLRAIHEGLKVVSTLDALRRIYQ